MNEHEELLWELVQSPYWRAVSQELTELEKAAHARLMDEPTQLLDLLRREGQVERLRAYKAVRDVIEGKARRYAKRLSAEDN